MSNVLEVSGLCKSYGGFALKDVSFKIPTGTICGFIGPNGAGKTTTIKSVLGMVNADSGSIKLFDENSCAAPGQQNGQIGVVMDTPFYVGDWTPSALEEVLAPFYPGWSGAQYSELLSKFNLDKDKRIKELSRGMKVKLMTAVALSHEPKLLVMDEPTSGLDPVARDELCDLLREFVADCHRAVLFSTHITADLERIADYIVFILGGSIVFSGRKDDLLERYVRVAGGPEELTDNVRSKVIGLREHPTGFEGMTESSYMHELPGALIAEQLTLDEIIVFMNKEAMRHE